MGALVGLVASLVAWRTTGLAFSMLTLAFAQSLYTLSIRSDFLGGYNGLSGFEMDTILGVDMSDPGLSVLRGDRLRRGDARFWVISHSPLGHS